MSGHDTERYLDRATRGLWGQARRDARLELRGAVEDKVYRFSLLGLSEPEAVRAALRDLGSPHAIARELGRVHSLPHVARAALLAGVAGLLGVQALAQVPTVRAIAERTAAGCQTIRILPSTDLSDRDRTDKEARLRAECEQAAASRSDLLNLQDIVAALKSGGVDAQQLDEHLILQFPGRPDSYTLPLYSSLKRVNGQAYLSKWTLPFILRTNLPDDVPLRLEGLVNPVLHLGPAQLQLGTPANPVQATDLYALLLMEDLPNLLAAETPPSLDLRLSAHQSSPTDDQGLRNLSVSAPDDTLYAVLSNERTVRPLPGPCECSHRFDLAVGQVRQGRVAVPLSSVDSKGKALPVRVMNTPAAFFAATARGEAAFLVYRLHPGQDLRALALTPVPAAQVRVTAPATLR